MNNIAVISRVAVAASGHSGGRLATHNQLIRRCVPPLGFRFLSSEEKEATEAVEVAIEKKAVKTKAGKEGTGGISDGRWTSPQGILRDRRNMPGVAVESAIRYLQSDPYKQTYGTHKVWQLYRRNFAGQWSPLKPRHSCITAEQVWTGNPCPICRDEYLVLHHRNLELLKQFINPHNGYVYPNTILCLCQVQYENLLAAIDLAKNYGLLTFEMPFRTYDYKEYYKDYKPELYDQSCGHNH